MIYIIRHGKTELNKANVLQGRSNHPLNEEGVEQAKKAAENLREIHFDHVFSSPLIRAVETAEIVCPDMKPVIDERLIEMDYGPYEGSDLQNPSPEVIAFFMDFAHTPAPEGMEQLSSVVSRAGDFIESIKNLSGNILISTHAIAMKGILEYLTPESKGAYWSKYIGNCAIYITENEGGLFSVPKEMHFGDAAQ